VTGADSFNSRVLFYTPAYWLCSNAPRVAAYHWPSYRSVDIHAGPYSRTKIQPSYESGRRGPDKCLTTKADTSVVSQLHTRVTGLEQKVANVESQISTYNDSKKKDENAIKDYVERAVEARSLLDVDETAEKEKRKTSVIIHQRVRQ